MTGNVVISGATVAVMRLDDTKFDFRLDTPDFAVGAYGTSTILLTVF